jgi:hypothetical protein
VNVSKKITINGQQYNSIDEMPPEVRALYEQSMSILADRNGNGIPDIMEGGNVKITGGENFKMISAVSRKITVNGESYENFEDLPAEVKEKFREARIRTQEALGGPAPTTMPRRQFPAVATPREGFSAMTLLFAFVAALAVTAVVAWVLVHRG